MIVGNMNMHDVHAVQWYAWTHVLFTYFLGTKYKIKVDEEGL